MDNTGFELNAITDDLSRSAKYIFGNRLRKIILYGSYARGDFNEYSDLDIMVLADFDESEHSELQTKVCKIASRTSLDHDITVCISLNDETLFMSRLDISPYYQNVMTEGIRLYETE